MIEREGKKKMRDPPSRPTSEYGCKARGGKLSRGFDPDPTFARSVSRWGAGPRSNQRCLKTMALESYIEDKTVCMGELEASSIETKADPAAKEEAMIEDKKCFRGFGGELRYRQNDEEGS